MVMDACDLTSQLSNHPTYKDSVYILSTFIMNAISKYGYLS